MVAVEDWCSDTSETAVSDNYWQGSVTVSTSATAYDYQGPDCAYFHDVPTEEQWVFLGRFDANRAAWVKRPSVPPRCGKATARREKPSRSRPGARGRRIRR